MNVAREGKEYGAFIGTWEKCRDTVSGSDSIKKAGIKYLPCPNGMDKDDYEKYKQRAGFFNATGRTLDGLHGMLFRINPIIAGSEDYKEYLINVDKKSNSIEQFLSQVTYDVLQVGFGGILVDAPQNNIKYSLLEAEQKKLYPYLSFYKAEDIINWGYIERGRAKTLSFVVLKEVQQVEKEPFLFEDVIKYRVLDLENDDLYRQRIFNADGETVEITVYPKQNNKTMDKIPFYFIPKKEPQKPILLDLIDVNLSWYRKSADYEAGLHYTSVPTPYTTGWTPEDNDNKIKLSSTAFLHFPEGTTTVGMLEFSGAGMQAIASAMNDNKEDMAILGARIISAERKGIESAETARIHRASENSVLSSFAHDLSITFTKALTKYLEWITNKDIDVSITMNTDYDVSKMSGGELNAYVGAWQSGAYSKRILFNNLKKGEIIPADISFDDMQTELEDEAPIIGKYKNDNI